MSKKMAIFAGKSIYGAALELQSRVFMKQWVKKITVRCCSNFGGKSKDFPVKSNKLDDSTLENSENYEVRRSINPSSLDEKSPDKDLKSGKLKSKEKKIWNSAVGSAVGEHEHKWRFAESNSIEEIDEFDAMEDHEEVLDELGTHNGNYEIKHLTPEPSKTKEAAEKTTNRLLAARLESLHMNSSHKAYTILVSFIMEIPTS